MPDDVIFGIARISIMGPCEESYGKPYLKATFVEGEREVKVNITTNVAEMIGGAGKGTRERFEESKKQKE